MGRTSAFLAVLTIALCGVAQGQTPEGPSYLLTLASLANVHVELDLPSAPGSLYMMTAASGDPQNGFAPFVKNLSLQCGGKAVALNRQGAVWKVEGASAAPCHASYDVDLSFATRHWPPGNEQAAFTDGKGMFAVSKALFLESDLAGERRLQIRMSRDWQLQTPWIADAHGVFHFARDDMLRDMIAFGELTADKSDAGVFRVTLVTFGSLRAQQPEVKAVIDKVAARYNGIFPDTEPASFLVVLIPGSQDDGEAYSHGFASTMRAPLRPDEKIVWANTIAHEMFHHWCGQTIRMDTDLEWFKEGFTEYNANLALVRDGEIGPADFSQKAATMIGQYEYFLASGLFKDVTLLTAGQNKGPDRFGVYAAGWVIAFATDQEIRAANGGRKDLSDLMRLLLDETKTTPLTMPVLMQAVESLAGAPARARIEHAITSRDSLRPENYLEAMGLHIDGQTYQDEFYVHPDPAASREQLALRRQWANF